MSFTASLDLAKVYRNRVFQSYSPVASHAQLSREFSPHDLLWRRGNVDTALFSASVRRTSLFVLRYGPEVEIRPEPFKDFALVQMPLRGAVDIECDGMSLTVAQGAAAVIAPRRSIQLVWQQGCEQLILKVPHALLRQVSCQLCSRSHCPTGEAGCNAPIEPVFALDARLLGQWQALVQQLLRCSAAPEDAALHPVWLDQFEQAVALFLLAHQPSALPYDTNDGDDEAIELSSSRAAQRKLEAIEAYMRQRLFAPISLADLAKAAGVSARTLNILCHRHRGEAPMTLLRNMRLEGARAKLLSDPAASVTDVALEYGFGHLGRFSAYYRKRFGELPRQTCALRR